MRQVSKGQRQAAVGVHISVLLLVLCLSTSRANGQARFVSFGPDQPIPSGFKTYSLFLIPSSEWLGRSEELLELHGAFQSFGDAIGDDHLAVWFRGADRELMSTDSLNRCKSYCDRFGLDYSGGPYVVVSDVNPDGEDAGGMEPVVIKLDRVKTSGIIRILNILEKDLRTRAFSGMI